MAEFGQDTLCIDTLLTGRMAKGVRVLAQRCYHRLITPMGMLRGGRDEKNFGLDLASYAGATHTRETDASIAPAIKNELMKEPQVSRVDVSLSSATDSNGLVTYTIGVDVKSADGPFRLVLAVSSITVELLGLEAA